VAWQNIGYNQPTQPGFYLGDGMTLPQPPPRITTTRREAVTEGATMRVFVALAALAAALPAADDPAPAGKPTLFLVGDSNRADRHEGPARAGATGSPPTSTRPRSRS